MDVNGVYKPIAFKDHNSPAGFTARHNTISFHPWHVKACGTQIDPVAW